MPGVTKEQIERAKKWDLLSYLQVYEPQELRRCGKEYKAVRKEMIEYQTAKRNVDRILGLDEPAQRKQQGRKQETEHCWRIITSLTLKELVKAEDESPYPALTQIEAWGVC